MPNVFQGSQVRLRAVEPGDWRFHHQWDLDTDNGRLTDEIWFPDSTLGAQAWAEEQAKRGDKNDTFRFQIVTTADDQLVGTINTHTCNPRCGTFMYGIAVHPDHRRKGFAVEAIGLVLHYYFNERRYQKVNAEVYSFNVPSITLHERLGFRLEGQLRRMVYTGGDFHDAMIYGLTAEEFTTAGWNPASK